MKEIDMSDKAISRRLRQTEQLRQLSLSLMKVKKIPDEKKHIEAQQNRKPEEISEKP